ncbi:MAG TPA: hypothetical protein EYN06_09320, partial [Myxococcales bacterium]|nr:hypothetical protein [Myxococcales bacterium]
MRHIGFSIVALALLWAIPGCGSDGSKEDGTATEGTTDAGTTTDGTTTDGTTTDGTTTDGTTTDGTTTDGTTTDGTTTDGTTTDGTTTDGTTTDGTTTDGTTTDGTTTDGTTTDGTTTDGTTTDGTTTDGTTTDGTTTDGTTTDGTTTDGTTTDGTTTDPPADSCDPNPCQNKGQCTAEGEKAVCDCTNTGYQGEYCETDIDECADGSDDCGPNATCTNYPGGFECQTGAEPTSCGAKGQGLEPIDCTKHGDKNAQCIFSNHCMCSINDGFVCEKVSGVGGGSECAPGSSCVPNSNKKLCTETMGEWMGDQCKCPNKATWDASVGCIKDAVTPAEKLCTETGGSWLPNTCGDWKCGEMPLCDAIIPGCNCGAKMSFDLEKGCFNDADCDGGDKPAEKLCTETGGSWLPDTCGDWKCGDPPACDAIIPGCNCGAKMSFDLEKGCFN